MIPVVSRYITQQDLIVGAVQEAARVMNHSDSGLARVQNLNDKSRRMLAFWLVVLVALVAFSGRLLAQNASTESRGAIRPIFGAYVPTGDQRDFLKDAVLAGAQASLNFASNLAVTGSFGWAPSKDKITSGDPTIDAYQYDLGLEARLPDAGLSGVTPFICAGVGGRTYSYRDLNVDSKTNVDGYGAVGVDVGAHRVGVRIEARDYVSRFQPLTGSGSSKTRNDIGVFAGLGVRF